METGRSGNFDLNIWVVWGEALVFAFASTRAVLEGEKSGFWFQVQVKKEQVISWWWGVCVYFSVLSL